MISNELKNEAMRLKQAFITEAKANAMLATQKTKETFSKVKEIIKIWR